MQRRHAPRKLGPRLEHRGRYWIADLRPWGGGQRTPLRNPSAPGWPDRGDRTEHEEIARRWAWKYVDLLMGDQKRAQLGLRPRAKPLGDLVERYLADRALTKAYSTQRNDGTAVETHLLAEFGGDADAEAIDRNALQLLFSRLTREGYAPGTLETYRLNIGSFFVWLGRAEGDNPARGLELPPVIENDARSFTDDEVEALRTAADDFDAGRVLAQGGRRAPIAMRRAIELGLGMGGRQAELFALEWTQFREASRTVRVVAQLARDGSGLAPLKGKRARTALVLPTWWEHHDRRTRGRVLGGSDQPAPRLLHSAFRWFNYLADHAGVNAPGIGWHTLRHTYARLFIELGGRLEELQKSLGHTSILTTERAYGHLSEDAAATLARQRIYAESAPIVPTPRRLARVK